MLSRLGSATSALKSTRASALACLVLAACGAGEKPPTQVVAKVNKEDITIHVLNAALARQPSQPAQEQVSRASQAALQRLVDQELMIQKAEQLRIDRDPKVVQALQAARRQIIANAYSLKISESVVAPTADEVHEFFRRNPELFENRRVYQLQEFLVQAGDDEATALRAKLQQAKGPKDFETTLGLAGAKFKTSTLVRSAEQLPMPMLGDLSKLRDGQWLSSAAQGQMAVTFLLASAPKPVTLLQATPAIEQFLINDRRRKVLFDDLRALRSSAQIEFLGEFKGMKLPEPGDSSPQVADFLKSQLGEGAGGAAAEPAARAASTNNLGAK